MESLHDFTRGKILGPLLKFAYPVFLALFLQAMYGAVDLLVVGKFATTADVSGVATGSQIMQSLTFVLTSFSIGITILLGQKIGEGKSELGGKVIGTGVALFAIIAAVCTVVFVAFTPEISALMQAPEEAFSQTVSYVRICSAGTIFIIAFNLLGSIFRGMGDSQNAADNRCDSVRCQYIRRSAACSGIQNGRGRRGIRNRACAGGKRCAFAYNNIAQGDAVCIFPCGYSHR